MTSGVIEFFGLKVEHTTIDDICTGVRRAVPEEDGGGFDYYNNFIDFSKAADKETIILKTLNKDYSPVAPRSQAVASFPTEESRIMKIMNMTTVLLTSDRVVHFMNSVARLLGKDIVLPVMAPGLTVVWEGKRFSYTWALHDVPPIPANMNVALHHSAVSMLTVFVWCLMGREFVYPSPLPLDEIEKLVTYEYELLKQKDRGK